MLIFVIGFGLLTYYIFSNINKISVEGFDIGGSIGDIGDIGDIVTNEGDEGNNEGDEGNNEDDKDDLPSPVCGFAEECYDPNNDNNNNNNDPNNDNNNNNNDDDDKGTSEEDKVGGVSTYTNEKYDITMKYPSGWNKDEGEDDDADDNSILIVTFSKDVHDYKGDVALYIDPDHNIPINDYLSNTIAEYQDLYEDDFHLIYSSANTNQRLAGYPAYLLEYTAKDELSDDLVNTRTLEKAAKIGDNYYFVQYYAEDGDEYAKSLPIAQKMMNSIKIDKPATSPLSQQQPPQQPQIIIPKSPLSQQQPPQQQPQQQPQIIIPKSNTPPIARDSSVVTTQNRSINIPLEISDKESDMVDIAIVEAPKFGELAIKDTNTKTLTYTPHSNYIGYDSFIFQGNDRKASSNNATVSIIVANLPPEPTSTSSTGKSLLTFSTEAGSQNNNSSAQTSINTPNILTNIQKLNNLNQVQLVDLIATEISNANNVDKNLVIQTVNDLSEKTKAKGGNVIESLKKIAENILNEPSRNVAKFIINTANKQ